MYRFIIQARLAPVLVCCAIAFALQSAAGAVVIVANRTKSAIRFEARPRSVAAPGSSETRDAPEGARGLKITLGAVGRSGSKWQRFTVEAGDVVAVPVDSADTLAVRGSGIGAYDLNAYGVYYIGPTRAGRVELREIDLGIAPAATSNRDVVGALADVAGPDVLGGSEEREKRRTISVALYVDEDEPAVEQLWQRRLQQRIAAASQIFERSCGLKLAVRSYGSWKSNDAVDDFELSLREFEAEVRPKDARLAIGFTSQYQVTKGRTHLGGTRGPLHTHILLREWSQHVSEVERLELLVHELSHFLGAAHSPESNSVMRPILGDRQAHARSFRIAVDPVNALVMSLVGEEIRDRGVISLGQLSAPARTRLEAVYSTLSRAMPKDPVAPAYLKLVQRRPSGVSLTPEP